MKKISVGLLIFLAYLSIMMFLMKKHPDALYVMAALMGGLFLFSMLVRYSIYFKPYFTSRFNIFTSKVHHQREFDLPKGILFDKIKEVLSEAGFKVRYADKTKGELFATSRMSIYSWGENIYIDLTEHGNVTKVDFCSACFFAVTSWGRNEKNYERLLDTFENSLII